MVSTRILQETHKFQTEFEDIIWRRQWRRQQRQPVNICSWIVCRSASGQCQFARWRYSGCDWPCEIYFILWRATENHDGMKRIRIHVIMLMRHNDLWLNKNVSYETRCFFSAQKRIVERDERTQAELKFQNLAHPLTDIWIGCMNKQRRYVIGTLNVR